MAKTRWELVLAAALLAAPIGARAQEAGDPVFAAAQQLVVQKKYVDAAPALEKFLAGYPKHAKALQAWLALGESLMALNKPEPATKAYLSVLADKPAPDLKAEALLGLGRARLSLKQDAAAAETLAEVFALTAQDSRNGPGASVLYGEALTRLGKHAEAVRAFERVQKWPEHPEAPRGFYMAGESYRLAGNHLEAALTLREVSQKYWRQPFAAQAGLSAGESYLALKQYDEAEQEFRRVLKEYLESPAAPRAQMGLGNIAFAKRDFGVARQAYQAAGLVFADSGIGPEAELRMADSYLAEKNIDEARVRYQKLIASVDRKIAGEAWYTLAQTYQQANDLGKAAEVFEKLGGDRTTGRWSHRGRIRLAEIRAGSGDVDKALVALRAVLADQPDRPAQDEAQVALGAALLKRGEAAAADTELAAVAQRVPPGEFTDLAVALSAQCRLELGDSAGALARSATLLSKPLPPEVRAELLATRGRAQLQLKQPEAAATLREVVDKHPASAAAPRAALALLNHYRDGKQDKLAEDLEKLIAQRYMGLLVASDGSLDAAVKELEAGRYAAAGKLFQKVLDGRPDRATRLKARAGLAKVSAGLKQRVETDRELAGMRTDGATPELMSRTTAEVAAMFERGGDAPVALAYYRQARESGADEETAPTLLLAMSRILSDAGKPAEATPLLDELVAKYPKSPVIPGALYAQAWSRLERQDAAGAAPLLQRILATYPKHPLAGDAAFRLGEIAFKAGSYPLAAERYRLAAASEGPAAEAAGYKLGWTLRQTKDHEGSAKAFIGVATRFPQGPLATESRVRAGEAFLELEKDAEALAQFQAAAKGAKPGETKLAMQARVGEALARLMQGDFNEARALAEEAAVPANGWYGGRAQLIRAEALFLKEGAKAALVEYARGASLFARFKDVAGEAQFRVGECHEKLGNMKAAHAAWQKVVDLYGETVWAERSRDRISRPAAAPAAG